MRLFNKPFSFALVALTVPLLFLPKINLLSVGGKETAGIRFDDLALFFVCILIGWAHFALNKRISPLEKWIVAIVASSLFSFAMNRFFVGEDWLHVNSNILYCLRIAEYFIFFYIGAMSTKFMRTSTVVKAFLLWNLILMVLQKTELIGRFSYEGYEASTSSRVVGIGSFPSEAGMFLVLCFAFLAFDQERSRANKFFPPNVGMFFSQTSTYWLFLICSVFIIITGSRIAIAAILFIFLFNIKDSLKERSAGSWFYAAVFLGGGLCLMTYLILKNKAIAERSFGLLSLANIDLIGLVWDKVSIAHDPIGNESVKYKAYDMSWWMRIHKWLYALKIYVLHPECWLQGVGPGFAMAALDGGFLRILTELGIIGCYLYWKMFSFIARQSVQLYWMVVGIAINMIFFDVYLAYKPMSLLFFVSGSAWAKRNEPVIGNVLVERAGEIWQAMANNFGKR